MIRLVFLIVAGALHAASADAAQMQPQTMPGMAPPLPGMAPLQEVPVLQNDLIVKAGSDRVFFTGDEYAVNAQGRNILAAQARWLLMNPATRAVIEGHADPRGSRSRALALGERRATAVRDYLIMLGVHPARLSIANWGEERPILPLPGHPASGQSDRVVTRIVR